MEIKKKLVPNFSSREGHKIEMVVVHISAGSLDSMTSWFMNPASQASSHYGLGKDSTVICYVEEQNKAWHAGVIYKPTAKIVKQNGTLNPNFYSIGIECEGTDLKNAPEAQRKALYSLISDICKRNGLPINRDTIVGHYEIATKTRVNDPSTDKTIMDKIVENVKILNGVDEMVPLMVPKSKVGIISKFLNNL